MVVCETKVKSSLFEGSVRQCGFTYFDYVPTVGLTSGLWYLRKDNPSNSFILKVVHKTSRFMTCSIEVLFMNCLFIAIFVYAPPNYALK